MEYIDSEPCPLIFVLGSVDNEPDVQQRLLKAIDGTLRDVDPRDLPRMIFQSVAEGHVFAEKKAQSSSEPCLDGVLKQDWAQKHTQKLPSVVIIMTPFSVDWSPSEWNKREIALQEKYNKSKAVLSTRDVKPLIVAVKIGVGLGIIDQDVMDERIISLKRHMQLDSRTFTFMTQQDLIALSPPMRKLCKNVREFSTAYYTSQVKRVQRNLEQRALLIQRTFVEGVVPVRYAFKIAFFSDFLGQRSQSLRFYRQSFLAVVALVGHVPLEIEVQLKHVAELLNRKICSWLLQTGQVREAAHQLKSLIECFRKEMHPTPLGNLLSNSAVLTHAPWLHHAWVAKQHAEFASLLERFDVPNSDESDRSFHFECAARSTIRRQAAFNATMRPTSTTGISSSTINSSPGASSSSGTASGGMFGGSPLQSSLNPLSSPISSPDPSFPSISALQGLKLKPPLFVGSAPLLLDGQNREVDCLSPASGTGTGAPAVPLLLRFLQHQESIITHTSLIVDRLTSAQASIPPGLKSRSAHMLAMVAEQCMAEGDFDVALANLSPLSSSLCTEGWVNCAAPLLRKQMACAVYLGRLQEFVSAALTLYAMADRLELGRWDLEELHRDVISVLFAGDPAVDGGTDTSAMRIAALSLQTPQKGSVALSVPIMQRPEFGMAATNEQPPEYFLPPNFSIDLSPTCTGARGCLLRIVTTLSQPKAESGARVSASLTVTSLFAGPIAFTELRVLLCGGLVAVRIVDPSAGVSTAISHVPTIEAGLNFASLQTRVFTFDLIVPDAASVDAAIRSTGSGAISSSPGAAAAAASASASASAPPPLPPINSEDSLLFVERVELELRPGGVVIDCAVGSGRFQRALAAGRQRAGAGGVTPVRELAAALTAGEAPALLQVQRPRPQVVLLSPKATAQQQQQQQQQQQYGGDPGVAVAATRLQGPLQRVDVVLGVPTGSLRRARVHLSSDCTAPSSAFDALFWYPDHTALAAVPSGSSGSTKPIALDEVVFHPLLLGLSGQPSCCLEIPDQPSGSEFIVPLFLRSAVPGLVNVRLHLEYLPREDPCSAISCEFDVPVQFVRPVSMGFSWAPLEGSLQAPQIQAETIGTGGASNGSVAVPVVARGQTHTLSCALTCLNALGGSIEVHAIRLVEEGVLGSRKRSLLRSSLDLGAYERCTFHAQVSFPAISTQLETSSSLALAIADPPSPVPSQLLSVGDVEVDWCLRGCDMLGAPVAAADSSNQNTLFWLPRLGQPTVADYSEASNQAEAAAFPSHLLSLCCDVNVGMTRVCRAVFPVPNVELSDAPIDASLHCQRQCGLGDALMLSIEVRNHLWSPERVLLSVELGEHFVITGATQTAVEVSPKGKATLSLVWVPLRCGHVPLPLLRVKWERGGLTLIDSVAALPVFVLPVQQ